jgi:NAD(P)-dependent dehydrogenase (short-subunit alcohol dehydrogenase family)
MSRRHGGEGGSIVNISSMNSVLGAGGRAVDYAATKGALDSLTIGASRELAKEGVRVNTVRPGPIDTDILDLKNNPARAESIKTLVPMGRVGQPIEAANAVLWFLSDESSFVTGTILNVSGGR